MMHAHTEVKQIQFVSLLNQPNDALNSTIYFISLD